jgi:hypothetical protein
MAVRSVDQIFREHEGDDYRVWLDRGPSAPPKVDHPQHLVPENVAAASRWFVVLAGSSLIAWLGL